MPRSKPIIIIQSIIAGLVVVLGTAGLTDLVPAQVIYATTVLVGAVQGGLGFYLSATNTSNPQVVATQQARGEPVIAGPAAYPVTGAALSPSSTVADVVPSAAE